MNGPSLVRPAFFFGLKPVTMLAAIMAALLWSAVAAQDTNPDERPDDRPDDDPAASAEGQAVDEEEAEFRRRMELEEGEAGELSTDVTLPDIVEVDPMGDPDDTLPPQSRDHIDEELTRLIIENGRWEPSDAEQPAPYTPSEAAQQDPELAAQEAEVWEEQVAAYHERERAAWEQAGGQSGGGQGQGQGTGSGAGAGSGSGAGAGASGGQMGDPSSGGVAGSEERPPEGEPFSALEFLGGAPPAESEGSEAEDPAEPQGVATQVPGGAGANEPDAENPDGAGAPAVSAASGDAGGDRETEGIPVALPPPVPEGPAGEPDLEQEPDPRIPGNAEAATAGEAGPETPAPGSGNAGAEAGQAGRETPPGAMAGNSGPPAGSVPTDAFEGLFETPETTSEDQVSEDRVSEGEGSGSGSPPSPPSFLDWLLGLFGGNDSSDAETAGDTEQPQP